jgi:hypothetical protein
LIIVVVACARHNTKDLADLLVIGAEAEVEFEGNMIFDLFFDPTRLCTCRFDSTTISSKPVLSAMGKPIVSYELTTVAWG